MKILIVKTSSLGDIIQAFDFLRPLKKAIPEIEIDWVVEEPCKELVITNPQINKPLVISTKKWRKLFSLGEIWQSFKEIREKNYDIVIDLQGNLKSGLITACAKGKRKIGFGKKSAREWINTFFTHEQFDFPSHLSVRESHLFLIQKALNISLEKPSFEKTDKPIRTIMVCPGSAWQNKQLSETALEDFLKKIEDHYPVKFLLVWGSHAEKEWVERLKNHLTRATIIDRVPLSELSVKMGSQADLVIAMDSMPLHLAGYAGIPTFSIFGPSRADKLIPIIPQTYAFQASCPYGKTFVKQCPLMRSCPTGACMKSLTGEQLFSEYQKLVMN